MKVCMVVPHFLPHIGGGEQLYYDIAKGLIENGYEVRVITSSSGGVKGNKPYEGVDAYYYDWSMFCGHPIVRFEDIKMHIEWADVIHTTMFTTATKTRILAQRMQKPCIITIHEVLGNKWFWIEKSKIKAFLFDVYERFICKQKFQAYHVVSDATKQDYEKFCGKNDKIFRIYNSVHMPSMESIKESLIDVKKYFELGESDKCFLFYGRPAPNKGVFVLEEAIEILATRGVIPDDIKFCMLLAKDPAPQREILIRKLNEKNLMSVVKIKPSVSRMQLFKIISQSDYVIIPSITEGFGFCAVEACSLNKHVIYSSGGSLPEVVFGKCLEFENRNAKDLADKIQQVIQKGPDVFTDIPRKEFKTERMVNEIIAMYRTVLSEWKK